MRLLPLPSFFGEFTPGLISAFCCVTLTFQKYRLIFVALVILTILTAVGVLVSSWPGHQNMRQNRTSGTAPVHDVPMSTAPPAPLPGAVPSELSARDAEALHDQAHSQSHSISSPSAVNSAELDGGNGHKY